MHRAPQIHNPTGYIDRIGDRVNREVGRVRLWVCQRILGLWAVIRSTLKSELFPTNVHLPLIHITASGQLFKALKLLESSSPGEFHPQALTDPCVTVSRHTALIIQPTIVDFAPF